MSPFLPARYGHLVFSLLVSGLMSFFVSGISTLIAIGPSSAFFGEWMLAWFPSWFFAFPAVMIVVPTVRRLMGRIVIPPKT